MLIGIPDIIDSGLSKALADTGHGDLIVIADHFYPHVTKCMDGVSIQAKGVGAVETLDAILQLVPLDVEFEKLSIQYIVPDKDSGIVVEDNPVWYAVKETVAKHGYDTKCIGTIERTKFYKKAKKAYITISIGKRQPYGRIILQMKPPMKSEPLRFGHHRWFCLCPCFQVVSMVQRRSRVWTRN